MQSVEPVLENAIKTLQKVVDVRGMGKKLIQIMSEEESTESIHIEDITQDAVDGAKATAIAKSVKDGEVAMAKAAENIEKAYAKAVADSGAGGALRIPKELLEKQKEQRRTILLRLARLAKRSH